MYKKTINILLITTVIFSFSSCAFLDKVKEVKIPTAEQQALILENSIPLLEGKVTKGQATIVKKIIVDFVTELDSQQDPNIIRTTLLTSFDQITNTQASKIAKVIVVVLDGYFTLPDVEFDKDKLKIVLQGAVDGIDVLIANTGTDIYVGASLDEDYNIYGSNVNWK